MVYKPQLIFGGGFVIGSIVGIMIINYYNVIIPREVFISNVADLKFKVKSISKKLSDYLENN